MAGKKDGARRGPKEKDSAGTKTARNSSSRADLTHKAAPKRNHWLWAVIALVAIAAGAVYYLQTRPKEVSGLGTADIVRIETSKGNIVMEVYPDLVPNTVANFESLVESGFYDGLIWHRVENWVVQTGDPEGTGYGGSNETIKLEINRKLSNVRSFVGMARSQDRDSASSQFYILKSDAVGLDGDYAVFGRVVQGMDVVDRLMASDKMLKVTLEKAEKPE